MLYNRLSVPRAFQTLRFTPAASLTTATSSQGYNFWRSRLREMGSKEEKQRLEDLRVAEGKKPPRNEHKKGPRLRGNRRDEEDVRISKTLSWVLRHGANTEGLLMRQDGYVRVRDLLALPRLRDVNFQRIEQIVQRDAKERYHLLFEPSKEENGVAGDCWWIRANQGHSMKDVNLDFTEITDAGQVPMAVHGTTYEAWSKIRLQGLSPMKRTHIHLAQHISHVKGVKATPGLRSSSQVLIFVALDKALRAGIRFYLSANGVILTKGDETGYLPSQFFQRVTDAQGRPLEGFSGTRENEIEHRIVKTKKRSRSRSNEAVGAPIGLSGPSADSALLETTKTLSNLDLSET